MQRGENRRFKALIAAASGMIGNKKRAAKKLLSSVVIDNGNITLRLFYHFKHTTGTGETQNNRSKTQDMKKLSKIKNYPCSKYRGYIIKIKVIILIMNTDIIPL